MKHGWTVREVRLSRVWWRWRAGSNVGKRVVGSNSYNPRARTICIREWLVRKLRSSRQRLFLVARHDSQLRCFAGQRATEDFFLFSFRSLRKFPHTSRHDVAAGLDKHAFRERNVRVRARRTRVITDPSETSLKAPLHRSRRNLMH